MLDDVGILLQSYFFRTTKNKRKALFARFSLFRGSKICNVNQRHRNLCCFLVNEKLCVELRFECGFTQTSPCWTWGRSHAQGFLANAQRDSRNKGHQRTSLQE